MPRVKKVISIVLTACILIAGGLAILRLARFFGWSLRPRPAAQTPARAPAIPSPLPPASPQTPQAPAPAPAHPPPLCTEAQASLPSAGSYGGGPIGLETRYLQGSEPTYAPNGLEVAFAGNGHIWIMGIDGRNLRRLSTDMDPDPAIRSYDSNPAWSPDSSRIAFASSGTTRNTDIWLIRPDGSNLTRLTTDPGIDNQPAWSPDGMRVAFASYHEGRSGIWIINADGSGLRRVTDHPQFENYPSFSPDGRQIVFSQATMSMTGCLMIVNADGSGLRLLTAGPVRQSRPNWGRQGILFHTDQDAGAPSVTWIVQPDGSQLRVVPNAAGTDPTWSPDGTRIAFSRDGNVYEFNFPDGALRAMVELQGYFIAIDIMPGRSPNTINLSKSARIPVAILSSPGFEPAEEIDQSSITFGPTGNERTPVSCFEQEVNQDRIRDLVCEFDVAIFRPGHGEGILRTIDFNGIPFEGRGVIQVLP